MRPQDWALLPEHGGAPRDPAKTASVAWGFYIRFLLEANRFYSFSSLKPNLYLHVAETKSVPNRPAAVAGEPQGRPLVVAWFETVEEAPDGIHVSPVETMVHELIV